VLRVPDGIPDQREGEVVETGKKYRFTYRIPGVHQVQRTGVAVFVSESRDALDRPVYAMSGRPEFGTTEVRGDWITQPVQEVPDTETCYMDRKVRP
jgi:hypothetical protein